jgi:hypothetical protein
LIESAEDHFETTAKERGASQKLGYMDVSTFKWHGIRWLRRQLALHCSFDEESTKIFEKNSFPAKF